MSDKTYQQPLLPVKIEPILALIEEKVPRMLQARDGAVAAMKTFIERFDSVFKNFQKDPSDKTEIEELLQEGNNLLLSVKKTYDGVSALRKQMSEPLDQIKDFLMQFEKDISTDTKAKNHYNDIRARIQQYRQAEIDANKKAEEAAARKKDIENYKVDLISAMKTNLVNVMAQRIEKANTGSRDHFNAATLENFEESASAYMNFKPRFKTDDYEQAFHIFFDKSKITQEEFDQLVAKAKTQETYEIWNGKIVEAITPILNEWRAKIPEIKAQKIAMSQADAEEKERLAKAQKQQDEAEDQRRKMEADRAIKEQESKIEKDREVSQMSNSFVEQAVVQQLESTGPSKKVLKFSDKVEEQHQAILSIIYHVMLLPKFPGIYSKQKDGSYKLDGKGAKEYHALVSSWIKTFETYCKDKTVEGATWVEEAKVIIRK